jgi:hypothetical protein
MGKPQKLERKWRPMTDSQKEAERALDVIARMGEWVPIDRGAAFDEALAALRRILAEQGEEIERLKAAACHHGWRGLPPENGDQIQTSGLRCGSKSLFTEEEWNQVAELFALLKQSLVRKP